MRTLNEDTDGVNCFCCVSFFSVLASEPGIFNGVGVGPAVEDDDEEEDVSTLLDT